MQRRSNAGGLDAEAEKIIAARGDRSPVCRAARRDLGHDRFRITYAAGHLAKPEIAQVNFGYADLAATLARYPINKLKEGFNDVNGERIFFIPTPSAGLWATRQKLYNRQSGFEV